MNDSHDFLGGNPAISAIPTYYAGYHFRSRLEARWAVFFDHMGIPWLYEPEGFTLAGKGYLPDFYLPECGTWCEVKGSLQGLDLGFLGLAAKHLPLLSEPTGEQGPRLLLLGPIPVPMDSGDYGWLSLGDEPARWGFGTYAKNQRPWWLHGAEDQPVATVLTPTIDPHEWDDAQAGYAAARSARFEHGQSGASL